MDELLSEATLNQRFLYDMAHRLCRHRRRPRDDPGDAIDDQ